MVWNASKWGLNTRTSISVLVPEFTLAPAAALGAVYCATTFTPRLLKQIEGIVSKHIVMPHLEWFESRSGSLQRVHEEYDKKKRARLIARGEQVPLVSEVPVASRQERADVFASLLTKGAIAMGADLLATGLGHRFLSTRLNVHVPKRVAVIESAVHLGGIAVMAGPMAALGENLHYGIKHGLQKLGMVRDKADDLGTAIPYIVLPGQVAALASLGFALGRARPRR